ncbi:MAG: Mrp/NBP35 family ATP-binding protein [Pirellulales bacterium]|nr:Mrp/NBP35 family ATP-binding protein [Pirellulales bacterium]
MAQKLSAADIEKALADFRDPESGHNVVQQGQARDFQVDGDRVSFTLALTTHSAPLWAETRAKAAQRVKEACPQAGEVTVHAAVHERPPVALGQVGVTAKSVIAVGSGKGGVGKSTVAASIAVGLQRAGCKVGLMDADVYGPSIPHLLGLSGQPVVNDKRITPIEADGLKVMSMGFVVPRGEAVVWRGPMLHGAITQFLRDTNWGPIDYIIIDMPPGTGDIALTLSQMLPLTGAVVVCTPQEVALLDAEKALAMFEKVNIPVLGIVENMSFFECPGCDKKYDIFGTGGAKQAASERKVSFLGEVPIQLPIRAMGDAGKAASVFEDQQAAPYFDAIVKQLAKNVADAKSSGDGPSLPQLSVLG